MFTVFLLSVSCNHATPNTNLNSQTSTAKPAAKPQTAPANVKPGSTTAAKSKTTTKTTTAKTTVKPTKGTAITSKTSNSNTTKNTGSSSTKSMTKSTTEGSRTNTTTNQTTTNTTNTNGSNNTPTTNGRNGANTEAGTNTNTNNGRNGTNNQPNTGGGNIITDITDNILGGGTGNFTELDAANAIKEALTKGVTTGVSKVSVTNGYFGNGMIKIPFPKDAQIVESTLRSVGMGSMIDQVVVSLNRAAESAATQAGPIFVNGIKQMTISDAVNIVSNKQPDAATKFLERTTTESLVSAFKPSIKSALDKSLATKYWGDVMNYYNQIPFVQKVNPDLNDFVTRKAISGLFYMIAQEEAQIRKDPMGQASDLLKKVFGNVKL